MYHPGKNKFHFLHIYHLQILHHILFSHYYNILLLFHTSYYLKIDRKRNYHPENNMSLFLQTYY
jgi:hypothetical protein